MFDYGINILITGGPTVKRKDKTMVKNTNNPKSIGKRNYKDKKFGFGGKKKGNKMNNK